VVLVVEGKWSWVSSFDMWGIVFFPTTIPLCCCFYHWGSLVLGLTSADAAVVAVVVVGAKISFFLIRKWS
jgi:hypothetical protein